MKQLMFFSFILFYSIEINAKKVHSWSLPDQKLKDVYICYENHNKKEILRLYNRGLYEHLLYEQKHNNEMFVKRNLGNYEVKNEKISFNDPFQKEFDGAFVTSTYRYAKGKIYRNYLKKIINPKKPLYKSTSKKEFKKPFFMRYDIEAIVSNKEAAENFNEHDLVNYLCSNNNSENDKFNKIVDFIVCSIEYDWEGFRTNNFKNRQNDLASILAGKNRVAVCAGYAFILAELCNKAGIKSNVVIGYTRSGHNDINKIAGRHAWNIVNLNGKDRLCDITWADNGQYKNNKWMDVDPELMIYSHFPDKKEDQLLALPFTKAEFLKSPVIKPNRENYFIPKTNIKGVHFCNNELSVSIYGKHNIEAFQIPEDAHKTIYLSENNKGKSYTYETINSVIVKHERDSTIIKIALNNKITPIILTIDKCIDISFLAINGVQEMLLKQYIADADVRYSDLFVKGVISAICLNDLTSLKELTKQGKYNFFDKKGNLTIDKASLEKIKKWNGELTGLTRLLSYKVNLNSNEKSSNESLYIQIPEGPRFYLAYKNNNYSIENIE